MFFPNIIGLLVRPEKELPLRVRANPIISGHKGFLLTIKTEVGFAVSATHGVK